MADNLFSSTIFRQENPSKRRDFFITGGAGVLFSSFIGFISVLKKIGAHTKRRACSKKGRADFFYRRKGLPFSYVIMAWVKSSESAPQIIATKTNTKLPGIDKKLMYMGMP